MGDVIRGEIVAVGTEMLLGDLIDTNSAFIAQQLKSIGVNMYYKTIIGDNIDRMASTIGQAHERSQVVITSGGLGPTVDDLTREAVAKVMGVELEFRQDLYDYISAYFVRRGFKMTENNRKQAFVPKGAIPIENPRGTAPCFYCEDQKGIILVSPGVPHEMRYIIGERAIPIIQEKFDLGEVIRTRVLKTCGLGESRVDQMIGDLFRNSVNPSIGVLAHPGQVDVRITARANSISEAEKMTDEMEKKINSILSHSIYGIGEVTLDEVLSNLLVKKNKTLSIVETNSGGSVVQRLGAWPQRVDFLKRAIVAFSCDEVSSILDTPVSNEMEHSIIAESFARGVREKSDADLGLAIFGPNPPENIEPEMSRRAPAIGPTHIVLNDRDNKSNFFESNFGGNEQFVQSRVPMFAMDLVRRSLLGVGAPHPF
ncbi:MAG: CinA family nicotinamide mononucleotide deamidase-related protein [Nitrospinota bacterium]|nr:CinA family nicotinamide mononucleotide deamidase-related protein [Nitrospinota bacterium]